MNEKLTDIALLINGQIFGDSSITLDAITNINDATVTSLVFAEDDKHLQLALASTAAVILTSEETNIETEKTIIKVSDPKMAFIHLLKHYYQKPPRKAGVHPTAFIADDVQLGEHCHIGAFAVIESGSIIGNHCCIHSHATIGRDVLLGNDVTLYPHVTIYDDSQLGNSVIIHASSVIGSDGFGYEFREGQHQKVVHVGNVIIGDDVEIGANTVIDKATLGATKIGQGTKIDNLVQVAHSVTLGDNNILCAFTGIAGSSQSGNNVIFAAGAGISDHVTIEDNVIIGPRSSVPARKKLNSGQVYLGTPSRPKNKAIEAELSVNRIPSMRKQLKNLKEKVKDLETRILE